MRLDQCHNIDDLRRLAEHRLPAPMFHYIDGGADDERTLRRNCSAFADYELIPEVLRDVSVIDTTHRIFGQQLALPFFLAPTGMSRLFHHERELGVARAAEQFGTLYSLSTMGTTTIEDVAAAASCPKMFQVYILKDRGLTSEFVTRCKEAKFEVLCLTVDMAMAGNRERDLRTGMVMPPKFGLGSLWSFATHPHWSVNFLLNPNFKLANVAHRVDALGDGAMGLIDYVNSQFDRTVTWKDVEWLRSQWDGPLVIKGVLSPDDAASAAKVGADAIMISNHGGRQLDGAISAVRALPAIRAAVGDAAVVLADGGVRSGLDVLRYRTLGADGVLLGRAWVWALAAGGEAGVAHMLALLRAELRAAMAFTGRTKL